MFSLKKCSLNLKPCNNGIKAIKTSGIWKLFFFGLGISAFDSSIALLNGRPFGGVAILWKKSLQSSVKVKIISERIMELDILTSIGSVALLNV